MPHAEIIMTEFVFKILILLKTTGRPYPFKKHFLCIGFTSSLHVYNESLAKHRTVTVHSLN